MNEKKTPLEAQISRPEEICTRLNLYLDSISELVKSDVPAAIAVCQEAISLARQPENKPYCQEELARCLFNLGMLNARSGNYLEAISIVYDAMPQIEKLNDSYLQARAINVIAVANGHLGNYYEALNHFMRALEIFKTIENRTWEAAVLNNIGYQYWHLENHEWALKYLNMSLSQAEKLETIDTERKSLEGDVCETLCNVYLSKGDYHEALKYGLRSLALYQEMQDGHAEAEVLNSIGDSYMALGQSEKALGCFQGALKLARETGHKHEEVETLLRLGQYYAYNANQTEALKVLKRALDIAEKLEVKRSIYESHQALAKVLKESGNFPEALEHSEKYFQLYKQVLDDKGSLRIQSLEIMHQLETARKDAEIYRLKNVALQNEIDERKKAQEALRKLATTDPLTGLFNRRYFFEVGEEAFSHARAVNPCLSVLLIDVDDFKAVNDRYGHAIGDQVLVRLARIMQESVRKVDIVARYGGEEFAILLPETSLSQAWDIAERLRRMVDLHPIDVSPYQIQIGISIGLAIFDQQGINLETLLNRADLAMYEAKQSGGNRVHLWGSDSV